MKILLWILIVVFVAIVLFCLFTCAFGLFWEVYVNQIRHDRRLKKKAIKEYAAKRQALIKDKKALSDKYTQQALLQKKIPDGYQGTPATAQNYYFGKSIAYGEILAILEHEQNKKKEE